jgi:hypothetical protein
MKAFQSYLKEIKLSRVFRHFKNKDVPVAIITAFRDSKPSGENYTYKENVQRNRVLAADIKNAKSYGFVYVEGHWQETMDDGTKKDVKEDSIMIIGRENDNGKLKGLLKKWIKQYNQDAALFKEEGTTDIVLLDQSGKTTNISNKFSLKKFEIGYTKLRGHGERVFSFSEWRAPLGWLGRWRERVLEERSNA